MSFLPSWRSYWGCLLLRKINNILLKIQTKMKSQDNKDWFRLRVNGLLEVFLARYSACHKTSCGCVLVLLLLLLCVGEPAFTNKIFKNKLFAARWHWRKSSFIILCRLETSIDCLQEISCCPRPKINCLRPQQPCKWQSEKKDGECYQN